MGEVVIFMVDGGGKARAAMGVFRKVCCFRSTEYTMDRPFPLQALAFRGEEVPVAEMNGLLIPKKLYENSLTINRVSIESVNKRDSKHTEKERNSDDKKFLPQILDSN
jgi:hypothetical protein